MEKRKGQLWDLLRKILKARTFEDQNLLELHDRPPSLALEHVGYSTPRDSDKQGSTAMTLIGALPTAADAETWEQMPDIRWTFNQYTLPTQRIEPLARSEHVFISWQTSP